MRPSTRSMSRNTPRVFHIDTRLTHARIHTPRIALNACRRMSASGATSASSGDAGGGPPTMSSMVVTSRRFASSRTLGFWPKLRFAESFVLKLAPLLGPIEVTERRLTLIRPSHLSSSDAARNRNPGAVTTTVGESGGASSMLSRRSGGIRCAASWRWYAR